MSEVTLTDQSLSLVALEEDREKLWAELETLAALQCSTMANAAKQILELSKTQVEVHAKLQAVENARKKIIENMKASECYGK